MTCFSVGKVPSTGEWVQRLTDKGKVWIRSLVLTTYGVFFLFLQRTGPVIWRGQVTRGGHRTVVVWAWRPPHGGRVVPSDVSPLYQFRTVAVRTICHFCKFYMTAAIFANTFGKCVNSAKTLRTSYLSLPSSDKIRTPIKQKDAEFRHFETIF